MKDHEEKLPETNLGEKVAKLRMDVDGMRGGMLGTIENPAGLMQNMLRVMETLYDKNTGLVATMARQEKRVDKLFLVGAILLGIINVLPKILETIKAAKAIIP